MEYIKLFETHSSYETFINGGGVAKPNVSHCIDDNHVHYNPHIPTSNTIVVNFMLEDEENVWVANSGVTEYVDAIVIDEHTVSIEDDLEIVDTYYSTIMSTGSHTIKYVLNETYEGTIPDRFFYYGSRSIFPHGSNITIPYGTTEIGASAFAYDNFNSIDIPDTVTTFGNGAFNCTSGLTQEQIRWMLSINPNAASFNCK